MKKTRMSKLASRATGIVAAVTFALVGGCVAPVSEYDDGDSEQFDDETALVTKTVSNSAGLHAALVGATAGDQIVLQDGTYTGAFTLSRSGSASSPIVIKPKNPGKVIFNNASLFLSGNHVRVERMIFQSKQGGGFAVRISGNKNRITRNTFRNSDNARAVQIVDRGSFNRVDHNAITDWNGFGLQLSPGDEEGMTGNRLDHNHIHDNLNVVGKEALQLGSQAATFYDLGTVVEYNLIERVGTDEENEAISIKSSGNIIRANTWKDCADHVVNIRHGVNNTVKNNTIINMSLGSLGDDHKIIGNRVLNGDIRLRSGNCRQENVPGGGGCFPAARNWLVAGNILENGSIIVGAGANSPIPAQGNTLAGNQAEIVRINENGTQILADFNGNPGEPVLLTPSMVGPNAAE